MSATACVLGAQDRPKQEAGIESVEEVQNPRHEAHDALRALAGTWRCTIQMAAIPGVPGMENPSEVRSIERAEFLCDGLWLKSTVDGAFMGEPFHGVWIAGDDPRESTYVGLWVDNHEPSTAEMRGSYDARTRTWTWAGKYTWSDFTGTMMGMPFEGHALVGFDAVRKEYVSYWFDSMSATWMRTTGSLDPESKAITMTGTSTDPDGRPVMVRELLTWKGDDERVLKMEFEAADGTRQMEIVYRRATRQR